VTEPSNFDRIKQIIRDAGGHFIGIQHALTEDCHPMAVFIKSLTDVKRLHLPVDEVTPEKVAAILAATYTKPKRIGVKFLQPILEQFQAATAALEKIMEDESTDGTK
jgi:hypothetical protein